MSMMQINIFLTLAEKGSFSKTAQELHMTQPGVSKSIAKLEEMLKMQLFIRTSRSVTLTNEGQLLYCEWGIAFRRLQSSYSKIYSEYQQKKNVLNCGISRGCDISTCLAKSIRICGQMYPEASLNLVEKPSNQLTFDLDSGLLDLIFVPDCERYRIDQVAKLKWKYIAKGNLLAYVSAKHPLSRKKTIHFSELLDCNLLVLSNFEALLETLRELFAQYGRKPIIALEKDDPLSLKVALSTSSELVVIADSFWAFDCDAIGCRRILIDDQAAGMICAWDQSKMSTSLKQVLSVFDLDELKRNNFRFE